MSSIDLTLMRPVSGPAAPSDSPSADRGSTSGVHTLHLPPARLRILVVDDQREQADSLVEVLESMGHTVRGAYDPMTALSIAPLFVADVALIDLGLPGMNGHQLAAELRRLLGDAMPVCLAFTGYDRPGDRARSTASGFAAHLVKPVDLDQLEAMLAKFARRAAIARRTGS